jgi:hypothetical protein
MTQARATVDIAEVATCNDGVFDRAREAADVVEAGHPRSPRPGGPFWLLVVAQTAAPYPVGQSPCAG